MGKVYPAIDEQLAEFLRGQHVFFVATAPLGASGHVNLSPKTGSSFDILDPVVVAYLDATGSGIETVAHVKENGRITLMFCAFEGPPKIVRLYGLAEVVEPGDADFDPLRARFRSRSDATPPVDSVRAVVRVHLTRIADSCGYGVPLYRYAEERDQLERWAERKGAEGIRDYQAKNNARSIDGLPGLRRS